MMRAILVALLLVLVTAPAAARHLASFHLPSPDTAAWARLVQVQGDRGNVVILIRLRFETADGLLDVLTTQDGTVAIIDPAPEDPEVPVWFDRGLCPHRGKFPESGRATGDFVRIAECPETAL